MCVETEQECKIVSFWVRKHKHTSEGKWFSWCWTHRTASKFGNRRDKSIEFHPCNRGKDNVKEVSRPT